MGSCFYEKNIIFDIPYEDAMIVAISDWIQRFRHKYHGVEKILNRVQTVITPRLFSHTCHDSVIRP